MVSQVQYVQSECGRCMDAVLSILLTRYMHVHRFMCLTQSTWKVVDWTKWQSAVEMVSWALRM